MNQTTLLAEFIANSQYEEIPYEVIEKMKTLTLDWFGSALAGKNHYPIGIFQNYAHKMGPIHGKSTVFRGLEKSSPYFAALINGASGHLLEQDDLHNSSVFHPGAVVFPALLAAGEDLGVDGKKFLLAAIMGYEAGIRIGEFLGESHYRVFHTTSTVGSLSSAIAVGKLMDFNQEQILNLMGNAATQSAGLWAFLEDAADSKQLHTAKANANGVLAAYMTKEGLTGAKNALESLQGLGQGMSCETDPRCLAEGLGDRWATIETSFKYHASCRHTHPAGDALLQVLQSNHLSHTDVKRVTAHTYQAALDVLGSVNNPKTVHQAKFSMGTVMGLLAVHGRAGLIEFDRYALTDFEVQAFREKVQIVIDPEIDAAYPKEWQGKVTVEMLDGSIYKAFIRYPKGDPKNSLTQKELEEKFYQLLHYSGEKKLLKKSHILISQIMSLEKIPNIEDITNTLY